MKDYTKPNIYTDSTYLVEDYKNLMAVFKRCLTPDEPCSMEKFKISRGLHPILKDLLYTMGRDIDYYEQLYESRRMRFPSDL